MDSRTTKHLPLLAALVAVVLWAAAFVGIRAAGRSFSPGALALGRLTIGSVLLGGVVLSRPVLRPTKRELGLLLLAGLLWFGVYNLALNEAERRVDAGTAARLAKARAACACRSVPASVFVLSTPSWPAMYKVRPTRTLCAPSGGAATPAAAGNAVLISGGLAPTRGPPYSPRNAASCQRSSSSRRFRSAA